MQGGDIPKSVAAGLPNITGKFATRYAEDALAGLIHLSGACTGNSPESVGADRQGSGYALLTLPSIVTFNAQKSNAIYGNSATVQPPAISLIPQIKF